MSGFEFRAHHVTESPVVEGAFLDAGAIRRRARPRQGVRRRRAGVREGRVRAEGARGAGGEGAVASWAVGGCLIFVARSRVQRSTWYASGLAHPFDA